MTFFGVLKDGDLEYDNLSMAAHIALRIKVIFKDFRITGQPLFMALCCSLFVLILIIIIIIIIIISRLVFE